MPLSKIDKGIERTESLFITSMGVVRKLRKAIKRIGKKVSAIAKRIIKYPRTHKHTVLGVIAGAVLGAGITARVSTNIGGKGPIPVEAHLDIKNHKAPPKALPRLRPEKEPEICQMRLELPSVIENILEVARVYPPVAVGEAMYRGAEIYGQLMSQARTPLVQTYFRDAECEIANWIDSNPKATENELRAKIETAIDFAYERSLHIVDMGP